MNIEHLSHWSGQLNREMYVNRYGHAGIPVVVFASSGGSHNEYYDFGMIDACAQFIEEGRVQFFTLSSVDSDSWLCNWKNPHDRAEMHRAYERYVIEEAILFSGVSPRRDGVCFSSRINRSVQSALYCVFQARTTFRLPSKNSLV